VVGNLLALIRSGPGPIVVITVPVLALALIQLVAIWRPRDEQGEVAPQETSTAGPSQ
jgi:hypothetical protein